MPLLRFIPEATKINFVGARYFAELVRQRLPRTT